MRARGLSDPNAPYKKKSRPVCRHKPRKKSKTHYSRRKKSYWNDHHILYQEKHWNHGYAQMLREHPYLRKKILRDTLHTKIHSKIHDIPTPPGRLCKKAYFELLRREEAGLIDVKNDTLEQRIEFLIEMWRGDCSATVEILKYQRDIAREYYNNLKKPKKSSTPPPDKSQG